MNELRDLSLEASCGNAAAADFLLIAVDAMHLWDDLIDKDKPVSDDKIHQVFTNLLTQLPINKFYQDYGVALSAVMLVSIQNWHVANAAERAQGADSPVVTLDIAFVLRSSYVDWITMVATLCGGTEHGRRIAAKIRMLAHREGYVTYLANLERERLIRAGDTHVL